MEEQMRFMCLACEALARAVYLCAARSQHLVDVELFRIGLHREPAELRARLQERIDAASGEGYDAVVMAYGLCGQSTAGLVAHDVPVVIPRAHDCITLFLGDRQRYSQAFTAHPGTYWYALDYAERSEGTMGLGAEVDAQTQDVYQEYVEKYGEDNAAYLMEVMGAWREHYDRAVYIDMGVGDGAAVEDRTREEAAGRGWTYERMAGDLVLIRRLLAGDWAEDFAIVDPGQHVVMSYDADVIGCRA
jgi:Protein of unknown function (DUF1638)